MPIYVEMYGIAFEKSIREFHDRQDMIMAQAPNLTTLAYINDPFTMDQGYFFEDTLLLLMEKFKQLQETSVESSRPEIFEGYTIRTELLTWIRDEKVPRYKDISLPRDVSIPCYDQSGLPTPHRQSGNRGRVVKTYRHKYFDLEEIHEVIWN
jgi:hypothetical protein